MTQSSDEFTFASNQIVKDLRSHSSDPKKTESTAGLESRFGASDTYIQSFRLNQNSWELKKNYLTGVEALTASFLPAVEIPPHVSLADSRSDGNSQRELFSNPLTVLCGLKQNNRPIPYWQLRSLRKFSCSCNMLKIRIFIMIASILGKPIEALSPIPGDVHFPFRRRSSKCFNASEPKPMQHNIQCNCNIGY